MQNNCPEPYKNFRFLVQIEGMGPEPGGPLCGFCEVHGLEASIDVVEYREGGGASLVYKVPGTHRYANVMLKRGLTRDLSLWKWTKEGLEGTVRRLNVIITLLDETSAPVIRWRLRRAWPCKYTGPTLDAKNGEVAIETVELTHEGLEIDS